MLCPRRRISVELRKLCVQILEARGGRAPLGRDPALEAPQLTRGGTTLGQDVFFYVPKLALDIFKPLARGGKLLPRGGALGGAHPLQKVFKLFLACGRLAELRLKRIYQVGGLAALFRLAAQGVYFVFQLGNLSVLVIAETALPLAQARFRRGGVRALVPGGDGREYPRLEL